MVRLYFLVPDAHRTLQITHELAELGLKKDEVHVLAHDQAKLEQMDVNRATLRQTTDVVNATKRGVLVGIPLGVLLGAIASFFIPIAGGWTGIIMLLIGAGLFGGLFGAWASSMIGVSVEDRKVTEYHDDIERGSFLMLVDVQDDREHEVITAVKRHHPEVTIDKITAADKHEVGGQGA